jgi:hypothetical protein
VILVRLDWADILERNREKPRREEPL